MGIVYHISNTKTIKMNYTRYKNSDFSVEDISFSIPKGSILGVIGENGAGKTTMLNTIIGLKEKTSGSVKIFGKDYLQLRSDELEKLYGYIRSKKETTGSGLLTKESITNNYIDMLVKKFEKINKKVVVVLIILLNLL